MPAVWLVFTYEYRGLQRTQTDPLNIVRTIIMDMFGRIVTVKEPHQSLIHYTYHPNGQTYVNPRWERAYNLL